VPPYFDLHDEANKNKPLILECDYDISPDETGFVLKWLHNSASIYQWIPLNNKQPSPMVSLFAQDLTRTLDYDMHAIFLQKGPFKSRVDFNYIEDLPEKERYSTLVSRTQ
jgi:hypothetical protein